MKTQFDDFQEERIEKKIAEILGISVEEYQSLDHRGIQEDTGNDGIVYRYYIEFEKESSKDILNKITNLDSSNTVYFNL